MWERAYLKQKAKDSLRGSYWQAFLVSLVIGIVSGGSGNINIGNNRNNRDSTGIQNWYNNQGQLRAGIIRIREDINSYNQTNADILSIIGIILGSVFVIMIIVMLGINIFLGYNLKVGGRRYFIQAAQGDFNMNYLGYGFKKGRYLSIIKSMIWRDIINFLWYLLFLIPGIIKSYAYSMVPYILADNPNIGYKRALELSNQMTKGEKWDMWVLNLSFIGWYLLGSIALGIGVLFVRPYDNATHGELYLVLRQQAIENGICDYRELNLIRQLKEEE